MEQVTYKCTRCEGKGRISGFGHVQGGVCFKCAGKGTQATKPAIKSVLFAVFLMNRETGQPERIYNMKARSSAAAISAAFNTYERASSIFRDIYTMNGAVAVRADELDNAE